MLLLINKTCGDLLGGGRAVRDFTSSYQLVALAALGVRKGVTLLIVS